MSSFMVGRYTLDSISLADLSASQTRWLSHGRGRTPMALPQRKAAGMRDPSQRYPCYSPYCVEGKFCELRVDGVLRSSSAPLCHGAHTFAQDGRMLHSSRGTATPREGAGSLPALLLDQGQPPFQPPAAFAWAGGRRRNRVHQTKQAT